MGKGSFVVVHLLTLCHQPATDGRLIRQHLKMISARGGHIGKNSYYLMKSIAMLHYVIVRTASCCLMILRGALIKSQRLWLHFIDQFYSVQIVRFQSADAVMLREKSSLFSNSETDSFARCSLQREQIKKVHSTAVLKFSLIMTWKGQ